MVRVPNTKNTVLWYIYCLKIKVFTLIFIFPTFSPIMAVSLSAAPNIQVFSLGFLDISRNDMYDMSPAMYDSLTCPQLQPLCLHTISLTW